MHLHPAHAVRDLPTLHAFIRAHPLGILTTSLPSSNFPTLQCSHIPWVLDAPESTETGTDADETSLDASTHNPPSPKASLGVLRGHIGRANPHAAAIIEAVTDVRPATPGSGSAVEDQGPGPAGPGAGHLLPGEVLIIFTSPVDHYITPHFYKTSGPATGKVAPTWNYAAVQVYGRMRVYHDSGLEQTGEWLHAQLGDLARLGEVGVMGHANAQGEGEGGDGEGKGRVSAWTLDDAPERFIAFLKRYVVGMEVEVTRVEGRFKVSQEQGNGDREGVVEGLEGIGGERARRMAGFVREKSVI